MIPTTQRMPRSTKARAGRLGEEIHVVAARDAGAQHFGGGVPGAVVDKALVHQRPLQRPDPLGQPARQRQVITGAPQQVHRRVGMRVHQAGRERVLRQPDVACRLELGARQRGRKHGHDATVLDRDRMVRQHGAARHDGHDPAGADQGFDGSHP